MEMLNDINRATIESNVEDEYADQTFETENATRIESRASSYFDDEEIDDIKAVPETVPSSDTTGGTGTSRPVRGPNKGGALDCRVRKHGRVTVRFDDELMRPVGPDAITLSNQIGVLLRVAIPIRVQDWSEVTEEMKKLIRQQILNHFELDMNNPVVIQSIDNVMKKILRDTRHTMYKFYRNLPDDKKRLVKHHNVPDMSDWEFLCDKWETPKWQDKQQRAQAARAALPYNHRLGSTSFAVKLDEVQQNTGVRLDPVDLFKVVRVDKEGNWINNKAKEVHDEMTALKESFTAPRGTPLTQAEICETVLGRRTDGIRGMTYLPQSKRGKRVSSSRASGSSQREMSDKLTELTMENEQMRTELTSVKEQMTQQIQEQVDQRVAALQDKMQADWEARIEQMIMRKMNDGSGPSK